MEAEAGGLLGGRILAAPLATQVGQKVWDYRGMEVGLGVGRAGYSAA